METPFLQRRYLVSFEARRLPHIFTDMLVIGAGVAGMRCAIEAAESGAEAIVVTKGGLEETNTWYAQGGLAAVIEPSDSVEGHVTDTLTAGAGLCDEPVVRDVVSAAPAHIEQLRRWGMSFDAADGRLHLGREGGHSAKRIVHTEDFSTGRALQTTLHAQLADRAGVKIWQECFVIDLITDPPAGGRGASCVGALTYHPRYGLQIILARRTVLAAGGAGMLWRETSNPPNATADGMAAAFRAGASIADAEMMQFHPTVLYVAGAGRSLISEAVRGEGAYLVNRRGERFMSEVHEMGELAPRDIVSRAILDQKARTGSDAVFLDVRHLGETFPQRFPYVTSQCRRFGINPETDLIPVHPAAHYMIGGARTDLLGRTTLGGLYACGEAACTGLHGANRLASNSLTESLVFAARCAEGLVSNGPRLEMRDIRWTNAESQRTELDLADIRNSLRSVMWRNVGIVRRGERLSETLEIVHFWGRYTLDKEFFSVAGWEVQNMLTAAYLITECALRRTETRGVHYREDFPETDEIWVRHQMLTRSPHQLVVE